MKNDKTDNEKKKPERVIKCELCSQLFSFEQIWTESYRKGTTPANFVFEPYICDPCYQEIEF